MPPELMGSALVGTAGLAHWGALVPSAVAACCSIGARRSRSITNAALGAVMLLAMVDVASGSGVVWPMAWCALLVALAVIPVMQARGSGSRPIMTMAAHRSVGMIAMAALIARMPGATTSTERADAHHASAAAPLITGGVSIYVAFSVVLIVAELREHRTLLGRAEPNSGTHRRHVLEFASMSSAIGLMAVAG